MGRAGAGKTSLMRSLIAGRSLLTGNLLLFHIFADHIGQISAGDGEDRATVSVDIEKWAVDQAKCTFWDFGGQEEVRKTFDNLNHFVE